MKKIILSGYMGSGKTTVAKLLSQATQIPYLDLDEVIENEAGKSVSQIFEQDGEIKFRKLEHDILDGLVKVDDDLIISLGGGTPCYANNHEVLQMEGVVSVYLKAGIDELIKRIKAQGNTRPLIAKFDDDELHEFVAKHLFDRSYYYHQSKHTVTTDGKTPDIVVTEIMSLF
jgi:shikimate kinase